MTPYILKTKDITKSYGDRIALNNINIEIKRGTIYGLIGRNGAGKTTLLKIISGLSFPDKGEVILFGEETNKNKDLLERIGVLIEEPGLYPDLNAYENMKLKCIAYGINTKGYIESLLDEVGLADTGKKKTKTFSLGMKQRLGIALALVGEPDLLLLDEPANGLDPEGMKEIRETLLSLADEKNITIIVSSHILDELSKLVTRIGIIDEGHLIEEIDKDKLLEKTKNKIEIMTEEVDRAVPILESNFAINNLKVVNNNTIYVYEKLDMSGEINTELSKMGITVDSISVNRETLEEYFIDLTGGGKNDEPN